VERRCASRDSVEACAFFPLFFSTTAFSPPPFLTFFTGGEASDLRHGFLFRLSASTFAFFARPASGRPRPAAAMAFAPFGGTPLGRGPAMIIALPPTTRKLQVPPHFPDLS